MPSYGLSKEWNLRQDNKRQNVVNGDTNPSDYELDHRMPLELGGSPADINNLSIEYPHSTNPKDLVENSLHRQVCSGQITLDQAQANLRAEWLGVYPDYLK